MTYYKVTYAVKARAEGWDDVYLDIGVNQLLTVTRNVGGQPTAVKELRPIFDAPGVPVSKPYPLDGAGKRKSAASDPPATITFRPYKWADWSSLRPFDPSIWA